MKDTKLKLESNDLNISKKNFDSVPSLIKWTGSKRLQAIEIQKYIPDKFNRYFEPFLGGGSILFNNSSHKSLCNDIYTPLIDLWKEVKTAPSVVIEQYTNDWLKLQKDFPNYYYEVRDRFNSKYKGLDLLFLSRTTVNGHWFKSSYRYQYLNMSGDNY